MVKPDVAWEGLTTGPPGANQYVRRLDEPTTSRMCVHIIVVVKQQRQRNR